MLWQKTIQPISINKISTSGKDMKTVHHVTPTFQQHDALGQHTKELHCLVQSLNCRSCIWSSDKRRSSPARNAKRLKISDSGEDVIIYQAATGSSVLEKVIKSNAQLIVNYHNITPATYFDQWSPDLASELRMGRRQLAALADRASLAIADSEYNAAELRSLGFSDVEVIPVLFKLGEKKKTNKRLEPIQSGSQWLFVGRIVPNKAQHDLIAAFAVYQKLYDQEAQLTLIGTGLAPYERAIQELIRELELQESVTLLGAVTEEKKRQHFLSSDVYVSLSEHEGFGVPLVEAMHYGLPIVAYEVAAIKETLGGKGLLIDSKKPTEVATVVHEVLQDSQILNSLVNDGYQRADELSFEANVESYKKVLSPLIFS